MVAIRTDNCKVHFEYFDDCFFFFIDYYADIYHRNITDEKTLKHGGKIEV